MNDIQMPGHIKVLALVPFCLVFIFSLQVTGQNNTTDWWRPAYDEGMRHLDTADYLAAEKIFLKLISQDKDLAQGYYGVGAVYLRQKPPRLKDARSYLRAALKKDPMMVAAWVDLGDVEEQYWPEEALDVYQKAVETLPGNRYLYTKFIISAQRHQEEGKVIDTLTRLVNLYPNEPGYLLEMAEAYALLDKFSESLAILDSLKTRFPDFSHCKKHLLRAKIYFAIGDLDAGGAYYTSAINNIQDSSEAQVFLDDLCFIMKNEEFEELQATQLANLWKYYHRFWRSRDPNLATAINERILDHYTRLAFARKHYRRIAEKARYTETLYEFIHPYAQYNMHGEELLKNTFNPAALPVNRDIDDLGLIYIRHGNPDDQVYSTSGLPLTASQTNTTAPPPLDPLSIPRADLGQSLLSMAFLSNVPMNLSWKYLPHAGRPEMIFHFKKFGGFAGWIIESIPHVVAEREMLDARYGQLALESFEARPRTTVIEEYCTRLEIENRKFVEIGMQSETPDFRFKAKPLNVPYQLLTFKGEDGNSLIDLYYLISGKDIQLDADNRLNLTQFAGFYDQAWNETLKLQQPFKGHITASAQEWQKQALVDARNFDLPPGRYQYELQFLDQNSQKMGVYRGAFQVDDYFKDSLLLSDAILSGPIVPADSNATFQRGNIAYTPHMFTGFRQGEQVGLYFEIYNLLYDDKGNTNFRVSCVLKPSGSEQSSLGNEISGFFKRLFSEEQPVVGTSYDYTGSQRDERIYMNFDLGDQSSGKFELVIDVTDLNTGTKTNKMIEITVI